MKKTIFAAIALGVLSLALIAADHIDAPAVGSLATGSTPADITDYYAFESPSNSDNYVFVCNVQGLSAPDADITFSDNVMYEFNIDTDADNIEDLVIQAIIRDGRVFTYGVVPVSTPGLESNIIVGDTRIEADITPRGTSAIIGSADGISIFAGPRDDPFFMDFFRFVDIVNGAGAALGLDVPPPLEGDAYPTSFREEGVDTFTGTNVLSVVIEVPKSSIGTGDTFSSWLESKMR
jgi:hypothetical protein